MTRVMCNKLYEVVVCVYSKVSRREKVGTIRRQTVYQNFRRTQLFAYDPNSELIVIFSELIAVDRIFPLYNRYRFGLDWIRRSGQFVSHTIAFNSAFTTLRRTTLRSQILLGTHRRYSASAQISLLGQTANFP